MNDTRIDIRIPESEKTRWGLYAQTLGITISELIRLVVNERIASRMGASEHTFLP